MVTVYSFSRRNAMQRKSAAIPPRNQDDSDGFKSRVLETLHKFFSPPVSQCSYVDDDPNVTSYEIICGIVIDRSTKTPYTFKFYDPVHIITGIACVPKDAKTSSPECEVVAGGIGCKEVEIVLTPVHIGHWSCCVQINGVAENLFETSRVPYRSTT
jgi:hypothetical protein